ncbi:hypothetical protein GSI_00617 [Ganoderma sinense ZZ0214-1]|uniref:Yeast cell wall synthesis Kre9/Knh1-like N-terminal domain-containing protein n=1 Tax=Ganoderma sinense ZZ0214-1 TaxID=1077348 RepID=A0A2G8ST21_9APHY|nr:hypothetical protein GSI_00617 [Ganoderma sinense ZZ0214-1]
MRAVFALLSFAASALAYSVIEPDATTGWTTSGPNVVVWQMVSTDPANFTIVLNNQNVTPATTQVLAALVGGSLGNVTVNPPSGGWKAGKGFRVNLVKDSQDLNSILAQSPQFDIVASSSSTFSTSVSATAGSATLTVPASATTDATTGSSASALNPTTSDTSTSPTKSNGASPAMAMSNGLVGALALLGAFLA